MSGYFSEILAIVQIYVSIWFIVNFHDYFIYFRIIKKIEIELESSLEQLDCTIPKGAKNWLKMTI